jgi:hypothetical protein
VISALAAPTVTAARRDCVVSRKRRRHRNRRQHARPCRPTLRTRRPHGPRPSGRVSRLCRRPTRRRHSSTPRSGRPTSSAPSSPRRRRRPDSCTRPNPHICLSRSHWAIYTAKLDRQTDLDGGQLVTTVGRQAQNLFPVWQPATRRLPSSQGGLPRRPRRCPHSLRQRAGECHPWRQRPCRLVCPHLVVCRCLVVACVAGRLLSGRSLVLPDEDGCGVFRDETAGHVDRAGS